MAKVIFAGQSLMSQAMSHGSGCTSLHPITPLLRARALGSTCSDIALLSCVYMRVVASATKATASAAVAATSGAAAVALVQSSHRSCYGSHRRCCGSRSRCYGRRRWRCFCEKFASAAKFFAFLAQFNLWFWAG